MSKFRIFIFVAAATYIVVDVFHQGLRPNTMVLAAVVIFCFYLNWYNSRQNQKKAAAAAAEEERRQERKNRKKHPAGKDTQP